MTEEQIVSWIFLSTALATSTEPSDIRGISIVADGINHAIPTQKELEASLSWLTQNGLVAKKGKKYCLTIEGKIKFENASKSTIIVFEIWKNLEKNIKKFA